MHTFYVPVLAPVGQAAVLAGDELRHLRVRRIREGEAVRLVDGAGGSADGTFEAGDRVRVQAVTQEPLPAVTFVVLQAALPAERLDWALEKAVEAGAHEIVVFEAERSALGKRQADRHDRWTRAVREACKQCGRARFPQVTFAASLDEALRVARCDLLWLADAAGARPQFGAPPARAGLLVGPEGGWTDREREAAIAAGARRVTFAPWVLRSETVAPLGLALLQYGYGKPPVTP